MKSTAIAFLLFLGICQTAHGQTRSKVLDLSIPSAVAHSEEAVWSGGSAGVFSSRRPSLALALTLNSVDRTEYGLFDPLIFTVTIQNIGRVPVTLPWSNAPVDFQGKGVRDTLRARLILEAQLGSETAAVSGVCCWARQMSRAR